MCACACRMRSSVATLNRQIVHWRSIANNSPRQQAKRRRRKGSHDRSGRWSSPTRAAVGWPCRRRRADVETGLVVLAVELAVEHQVTAADCSRCDGRALEQDRADAGRPQGRDHLGRHLVDGHGPGRSARVRRLTTPSGFPAPSGLGLRARTHAQRAVEPAPAHLHRDVWLLITWARRSAGMGCRSRPLPVGPEGPPPARATAPTLVVLAFWSEVEQEMDAAGGP